MCAASVGSGLLAAVIVAMAIPPSVAAQIPGESVFGSRVSLRAEFLAHTRKEISALLADWAQAVDRRDHRAVADLLADDVLYSPLDGWLARGRRDVADSLSRFLAQVSGYGLTIDDFDASATLAYVLGGVYYQVASPSGPHVARAQVVVVLSRQGTRWKLRSYLERANDPDR